MMWIPWLRIQTFLREQIAYQRLKMDHQPPHFCTMCVQSYHLPSSIRWTFSFAGLVLLFSGCQNSDAYAPFERTPTDLGSTTSESWKEVRDGAVPSAERPNGTWQGPLISDILQLGPWPAKSETERAALDTAWRQFTAFKGTQVAIGGIDSALHLSLIHI